MSASDYVAQRILLVLCTILSLFLSLIGPRAFRPCPNCLRLSVYSTDFIIPSVYGTRKVFIIALDFSVNVAVADRLRSCHRICQMISLELFYDYSIYITFIKTVPGTNCTANLTLKSAGACTARRTCIRAKSRTFTGKKAFDFYVLFIH